MTFVLTSSSLTLTPLKNPKKIYGHFILYSCFSLLILINVNCFRSFNFFFLYFKEREKKIFPRFLDAFSHLYEGASVGLPRGLPF